MKHGRPDLSAVARALGSTRYGSHGYVVFGSAVLYAHGLRYAVGDIDVFVRRGVYELLKGRGWREAWPVAGDPPLLEGDVGAGVPVHAFREWTYSDPHVDVGACFRWSELVDGVPCVPLWLIRAHKVGALAISAGWPPEDQARYHGKHVLDLASIDERLRAA